MDNSPTPSVWCPGNSSAKETLQTSQPELVPTTTQRSDLTIPSTHNSINRTEERELSYYTVHSVATNLPSTAPVGATNGEWTTQQTTGRPQVNDSTRTSDYSGMTDILESSSMEVDSIVERETRSTETTTQVYSTEGSDSPKYTTQPLSAISLKTSTAFVNVVSQDFSATISNTNGRSSVLETVHISMTTTVLPEDVQRERSAQGSIFPIPNCF